MLRNKANMSQNKAGIKWEDCFALDRNEIDWFDMHNYNNFKYTLDTQLRFFLF